MSDYHPNKENVPLNQPFYLRPGENLPREFVEACKPGIVPGGAADEFQRRLKEQAASEQAAAEAALQAEQDAAAQAAKDRAELESQRRFTEGVRAEVERCLGRMKN